MTEVCFFGAYDPGYPRNRILRAGLARAGMSVRESRVPERRAWRRFPELAAAFGREGIGSDVMLVPEFRHKDVPLARLLAGRRRLVFDPLVSRYDTLVEDWKKHAPGSLQAGWNRLLDRLSMALPDVVLCDTWAHGALFETLGVPRAKLRRVIVGAEDAFFAVGPPAASTPLRIVYVGGFLPLHGVKTVIEAAALLESMPAALPEYTIELAGRGIEFGEARARAAELGLARVAFPGSVRYAELPAFLAHAHIVLGAFGIGAKAGRVIPHKVYQGLACGRAVVSGEGAGPLELFEPGEHLALVPRGDAEALAETLARLLHDAAWRDALARRGRARALEVATPERIGGTLAAILAEAA